MKISTEALKHILSVRGLNAPTLARRTGIAQDELSQFFDGKDFLSDHQKKLLADELAVPVQALFSKKLLPLFPVVDFRAVDPRQSEFERGTLDAIAFVEKIAGAFSDLDVKILVDDRIDEVKSDLDLKSATELAKKWRKIWGLSTEEQLEMRDANKVYVSLRSFIENLGIVVIHRRFDTDEAAGVYARLAGIPHAIIINTTKSSKARKLFTLAHEFCHVLLRKDGASNPSITTNKIERFCNKFAAYLLAPDDLISKCLTRFGYKPSIDGDFIRLFSKNLGISQEAAVLRLVETAHLTAAEHSSWRSRFNGKTPPADTANGGGGQSDPLQTKRTTYGQLLLKVLKQARVSEKLDEIDIFRLSGLKPKYQSQLFGDA